MSKIDNITMRPSHPGALLKDTVIPALKISKTSFAKQVGLTRAALYNILDGKSAVTPEVAVRLGKLLGNGPELWLNMQTAYDLYNAKRAVDVSRIKTLRVDEADNHAHA